MKSHQTTASCPSESLANLLHRRARELDCSLAWIATQAGITRAYLHKLAREKVPNPGIRTLQSLARALRLPPVALYRLFANEACQPPGTLSHTGAADARDALLLVSSHTSPANTVFYPGERFTHTWLVQNAGKVAWPMRQLVRQDQALVIAQRGPHGQLSALAEISLLSQESRIDIPATRPGQVIEVSVVFQAPQHNGSVGSVWRVETPEGMPCYGARCLMTASVMVMGNS